MWYPRATIAAKVIVLTIMCACSEANAPETLPSTVPQTVPIASTANDWYTTNLAEVYDLAVWASPYAVSPGDTLSVFVHAKSATVSVRVFRLGWYGASGGQLVWHEDGIPAIQQSECSPAFPGPVECRWTRTLGIQVKSGWASGIYMLRVINSEGLSALYPFVVRGTIRADFTVVVPQFTWQAYNTYGGSSLYTLDPSTGRNAPSVSFERPYDHNGGATVLYQAGSSNDISVLRWLEQSGYSLNYVSDLDLTELGKREAPFGKGLLFIGHDEYWTWQEFDNVQAARDSGKHLVFFAGNTAYWNIRLRPGTFTGQPGGVIDCFKWIGDPGASTPTQVTVGFRNPPLNRPENQLTGIMYNGIGGEANAYPLPFVVADSNAGPEAREFLGSAGLVPGDSILGVVGSEGDMVVNNGHTPPNLQVLLRATVMVKTGRIYNRAAFYVSPSGAGVFAAGNNEFGRGLDGLFGKVDPHLTAFMSSVLRWMATR
jgi:hypothetical protein